MMLRTLLRCAAPRSSRVPAPRRRCATRVVSRAAQPASVDATTLCAAVAEAAEALCLPAKVQSVVQTDAHTVCLLLRTASAPGRAALWLSWHPVSARLCLGPPPPAQADADVFSFAGQLRAALSGAALVSCGVTEPTERVARLEFAARPGEPPTHALVLEALGVHANLVLLRCPGELVSCLGYQTGERHTRSRPLMKTGDAYAPPQLASGALPGTDWRSAAMQHASAQGVAGSVVRVLAGASPQLARALCAVARVEPLQAAQSLSEGEWKALEAAAAAWGDALRAGTAAALPPGRFGVPGTVPPTGHPQSREGHLVGPVGTALHVLHAGFARGDALRRRHASLLASVRAALKKALARARSFQQAVDASERAAPLRCTADLLLSQLHLAQPGASTVTITDWATGAPTVVPLDPAKTALHAAQKMHARARKHARGADTCAPLLAAAHAEAEYLSSVEEQLMALELGGEGDEGDADGAVFAEIESELVDAQLVKPSAAAAARAQAVARKGKGAKAVKGGAAAGPPAGVRRFQAPSGAEVYVGRNNRGNETVSHSLARDADLWFHARGVPGAHVLLRLPSGGTHAPDDLQFAADLAAFFSRERGAGKALVSYAPARCVRRAPGGRPGAVTMSQEDTVVGRPQEGRTAALAAGQAED